MYLTQLANTWIIANPICSNTLLCISKVSQLEGNIKTIHIYKKLNKSISVEIEIILGNAHKVWISYKDWKSYLVKKY